MDLFEEIKEIICEQLKAKPEEVKLETSFIDDLGADSLDSIQLVMALEEKFSRQSGIPQKVKKKRETLKFLMRMLKG